MSIYLYLAAFALLIGAAIAMVLSPDPPPDIPPERVDRWLTIPYDRALMGFLPCLAVMVIGLALVAEIAQGLF